MILSSRPYINTGFPTLKSEATTEEGSLDLLRKHLCFDKTMWFDDEGGGRLDKEGGGKNEVFTRVLSESKSWVIDRCTHAKKKNR